jgi:hypothetical protein
MKIRDIVAACSQSIRWSASSTCSSSIVDPDGFDDASIMTHAPGVALSGG